MSKMDVFGVIPARAGSKRIPRKNLSRVGGKPLIAHTIEQAEDASTIDRCIVSTDDDDIADVAREYGGDVPFRRPAELATDTASSMAVIAHALDWVESRGESPSVVVLLQATSPFRTAEDIDAAIKRFQRREDASSLVSITEFWTPPLWAIVVDEESFLRPEFERGGLWGDDPTRSQDVETFHYPNGAIYVADTGTFREYESFYTDRTIGYVMPPERSIDIDEPFELEVAQALVERRADRDSNRTR